MPETALEKIVVGDDQLLAAQTTDPGTLQSNMLNGTRKCVDHNKITDHKRFIKDNRQGRKEITQDVLYRQRNGDATDAESGNQSCSLLPRYMVSSKAISIPFQADHLFRSHFSPSITIYTIREVPIISPHCRKPIGWLPKAVFMTGR